MRTKLQPMPISDCTITGSFWQKYREKARTQVIPYQWDALNDRIPNAEPSHAIKNFRIAAGKETGEYHGFVFQESDIAKWLEAVAYTLMWHKDPELEKLADSAIDDVVAVQQPDGYLNAYYIIKGLDKRFTNLRDNHELYCLGHFIEAAVAYYQATGKDKLLQAMVKYVDLVDKLMGPEEGKLRGYPGHQEIELALVKLYEITKNEKHLRLAKYFLDERGRKPFFFELEHVNGNTNNAYHQSHEPVRDQKVAIGHSVRALYMYAGMADVARETNDEELLQACRTLWHDVTRRQMYVTGGVGQTHHGEAFTYGYDLPNDTIYAETCASIALVFFAERMLNIEPHSDYADVLELALHNGTISGMSADGKSFFYVNPLESNPEASAKDWGKRHVKVERQKWFGCSCCPPNLARMLTSLERYAYSKGEETLYVNLYTGGTVNTSFASGNFGIEIATEYPWEGHIGITIKENTGTVLALRLPGWCKNYSIQHNGNVVHAKIKNGYALIQDTAAGDIIELVLDMPVETLESNPKVRENIGKIAVKRGPVVYCIEEADNGKNLHHVLACKDSAFECNYDDTFFDGATLLTSNGKRLATAPSLWSDNELYKTYTPEHTSYKNIKLTWIPYYLWANRGEGEMMCWVRGV